MRARLVSSALAVGVGAALLIGWWADRSPVALDTANVMPVTPAAPAAPGNVPATAAGSGNAAAPAAAPLGDRMRTFLQAAPAMEAAARQAQGAALRAEVLAREHEGALLPAESVYLQLALLRVTVTDEASRQARSEALLAAYEARSATGWARYRATPDPQHEAYRAAEAALVARATSGPRPLSQNELRERLQALRELYYDDAALP